MDLLSVVGTDMAKIDRAIALIDRLLKASEPEWVQPELDLVEA